MSRVCGGGMSERRGASWEQVVRPYPPLRRPLLRTPPTAAVLPQALRRPCLHWAWHFHPGMTVDMSLYRRLRRTFRFGGRSRPLSRRSSALGRPRLRGMCNVQLAPCIAEARSCVEWNGDPTRVACRSCEYGEVSLIIASLCISMDRRDDPHDRCGISTLL